jgi:hypothetical protein
MPDGGGAEAARRILMRNPDIRIVALAASHSHGAADEMHRAGAFSVLHKGGSTQELGRTFTRRSAPQRRNVPTRERTISPPADIAIPLRDAQCFVGLGLGRGGDDGIGIVHTVLRTPR